MITNYIPKKAKGDNLIFSSPEQDKLSSEGIEQTNSLLWYSPPRVITNHKRITRVLENIYMDITQGANKQQLQFNENKSAITQIYPQLGGLEKITVTYDENGHFKYSMNSTLLVKQRILDDGTYQFVSNTAITKPSVMPNQVHAFHNNVVFNIIIDGTNIRVREFNIVNNEYYDRSVSLGFSKNATTLLSYAIIKNKLLIMAKSSLSISGDFTSEYRTSFQETYYYVYDPINHTLISRGDRGYFDHLTYKQDGDNITILSSNTGNYDFLMLTTLTLDDSLYVSQVSQKTLLQRQTYNPYGKRMEFHWEVYNDRIYISYPVWSSGNPRTAGSMYTYFISCNLSGNDFKVHKNTYIDYVSGLEVRINPCLIADEFALNPTLAYNTVKGVRIKTEGGKLEKIKDGIKTLIEPNQEILVSSNFELSYDKALNLIATEI